MLSFCCSEVSRSVHASLVAAALVFSGHANAALLQINSTLSEVAYTAGVGISGCIADPSGLVVCSTPPEPQTAALSGQIDLSVVHEHWEFNAHVTDRDLLYLDTIDFSAGALASNFSLAGAVGLINGMNFQVSDDPCFLAPFPMCSWSGFGNIHWGSGGTWDGQTLSWRGYSYENFGDSLTYTIIAEVTSPAAAIPEPASWVLAGLGLAGVGLSRRRRSLGPPK